MQRLSIAWFEDQGFIVAHQRHQSASNAEDIAAIIWRIGIVGFNASALSTLSRASSIRPNSYKRQHDCFAPQVVRLDHDSLVVTGKRIFEPLQISKNYAELFNGAAFFGQVRRPFHNLQALLQAPAPTARAAIGERLAESRSDR
jgi:hypothetical protein